MKAINLNHASSKTTQPASWLLLLLGTALLLTAFWKTQNYTQRNLELQAKIDARKLQSLPQRSIAALPDAKSEAAKMAIQQLVIPWAALLKALETANHEGVKMLAFEPNPKTRSVKLNLIALNQDSMWEYLETLKAQPILHEVRLISNQPTELNGIRVMGFWVEAKWQS